LYRAFIYFTSCGVSLNLALNANKHAIGTGVL
jgi:hypothetical protein